MASEEDFSKLVEILCTVSLPKIEQACREGFVDL
jgi:hypothetical protein